MRDEKLNHYFGSTPGWRRQLTLLRKKSLSGYKGGRIRLEDATAEECLAAERLLGRHFVPPRLDYKVSDFEAALRSSAFSVQDMPEFWLRLDGAPLISRPVRKAARKGAVTQFFDTEAEKEHGSAAANWLHDMAEKKSYGYQVIAPLIEKEPRAARWLHWVCCTLDRLQQRSRPEELALCSCAVTGDPHTLDKDTPAGHLLIHGLAHWKGCEVPKRGRAYQALLRQCGLLSDDLSNVTVQRGLCFLCPDGQEHPAFGAFRREGVFCLLTASQLDGLQAKSPTGRVYILENQMVFSSLCRCPGVLHPTICTSGQLREASWRLLDLLAQSGCQFWYAGDFDPAGIRIADRLWQEYGDRIRFWRMTPQDYQAASPDREIDDPAQLQQLEKIQCPALHPVARAILHQKKAAYQEALTDRYWEDLQSKF